MRSFALLLVLILTGCDNPLTGDPSLSGRWAGATLDGAVTLDLSLVQTEGEVRGSGVMTHEVSWFGEVVIASPDVDVAGSHDFPDLALWLYFGSSGERRITGRMQGSDRWTGSICSSGGGCAPLEMTRR